MARPASWTAVMELCWFCPAERDPVLHTPGPPPPSLQHPHPACPGHRICLRLHPGATGRKYRLTSTHRLPCKHTLLVEEGRVLSDDVFSDSAASIRLKYMSTALCYTCEFIIWYFAICNFNIIAGKHQYCWSILRFSPTTVRHNGKCLQYENLTLVGKSASGLPLRWMVALYTVEIK